MRIITQCDAEQWNLLVTTAQTGYITQMWEWGQLTHLGRTHRIAVADDTGSYIATIALIEVTAPFIRRPYFYAPRGPVCDDSHSPALALLLQAVQQLATDRGCFMLKLEPQVAADNQTWRQMLHQLGLKPNPYATHPRRSWLLDIRPATDDLLANMSMSSRQNVRKGLQRVHIRAGQGQEDLDHFYRIYTDTAQRDHFFIHPQQHYDEMISLFTATGSGCFWLAERDGVPIAAQVVMTCGMVATSMFSASSSLKEYRALRPNHPLQWTAILWAKAQGCTTYDFRAIAEHLEPDAELYGLYNYKRGYGGYSWLSMVTHDAIYQPTYYFAYRQALQFKREREHWQHLQQYHAQQQQGKIAVKETTAS